MKKTIWQEWRAGYYGEAGPLFNMHRIVADFTAQALGTKTGPDHDIVLNGRLVSVAACVVMPDGPEPSDDDVRTAIGKGVAAAVAHVRALA